MSKSNPPKKRVVVATTEPAAQRRPKTATPSTRVSRTATVHAELIFGRQNYVLFGAGAVLIALGFLLMGGGAMPSPDVWEPERIYGFRRTVLAPAVIIAGLVVIIFGIFKRSSPEKQEAA